MNLQENIQRIREMMGLLTEENQEKEIILIDGTSSAGKSTIYHLSCFPLVTLLLTISKWLMSWVFPGVPEVLAKFFCKQIALIMEDLPTLLLPIKAYSGAFNEGH